MDSEGACKRGPRRHPVLVRRGGGGGVERSRQSFLHHADSGNSYKNLASVAKYERERAIAAVSFPVQRPRIQVACRCPA